MGNGLILHLGRGLLLALLQSIIYSQPFLDLSKGSTMAEAMKTEYAASEVHDAIKDLLVLCES
jgi:hypothetical protein